MKQIYKYLEHDKMLHYFFGSLLSLIGFVYYLNGGSIINIIAIPFTVAVIKEVSDIYISKTGFNYKDLLFSIMFGVILTLIIII